MENNINFSKMWNEQNIAQADVQNIFNRIKKYRQKNLSQIIFANGISILTTVFIIVIWYFAKPQFISTKIGIVITILAMIIFLFAYNKQFPLLKKLNETNSNKSYLENLLMLQEKQKKLHSKMVSLYFIMLSLGIGLYMIEYAARMPLLLAIACYATVAIWFLFNWFYLRPKTIAKQQNKLNTLIEHLNNIQNQIEE